jgi:hypothetical protein
MLSHTIKTIAKKIKSGSCKGYFDIIHLSKYAISFKNCHGCIISYQSGPDIEQHYNLYPGCGILRAGYVREGQIFASTYESEYSNYSLIDVAEFKPFLEQPTDNPDFIKRTALSILFN